MVDGKGRVVGVKRDLVYRQKRPSIQAKDTQYAGQAHEIVDWKGWVAVGGCTHKHTHTHTHTHTCLIRQVYDSEKKGSFSHKEKCVSFFLKKLDNISETKITTLKEKRSSDLAFEFHSKLREIRTPKIRIPKIRVHSCPLNKSFRFPHRRRRRQEKGMRERHGGVERRRHSLLLHTSSLFGYNELVIPALMHACPCPRKGGDALLGEEGLRKKHYVGPACKGFALMMGKCTCLMVQKMCF